MAFGEQMAYPARLGDEGRVPAPLPPHIKQRVMEHEQLIVELEKELGRLRDDYNHLVILLVQQVGLEVPAQPSNR